MYIYDTDLFVVIVLFNQPQAFSGLLSCNSSPCPMFFAFGERMLREESRPEVTDGRLAGLVNLRFLCLARGEAAGIEASTISAMTGLEVLTGWEGKQAGCPELATLTSLRELVLSDGLPSRETLSQWVSTGMCILYWVLGLGIGMCILYWGLGIGMCSLYWGLGIGYWDVYSVLGIGDWDVYSVLGIGDWGLGCVCLLLILLRFHCLFVFFFIPFRRNGDVEFGHDAPAHGPEEYPQLGGRAEAASIGKPAAGIHGLG